jgi:hypothetical protein
MSTVIDFLETAIAGKITSLLSSSGAATYSFKNLNGVFAHTSAGTYTFGGAENRGINQITVSYLAENTVQDISVDGGIFVLPTPIWNGMVTIDVMQTSLFNQFLLSWYNTIRTEATQSTPSWDNWANASMLLVKTDSLLSTTTTHTITGISPQKRPDETFAAQGGNVVWNLMAANITS